MKASSVKGVANTEGNTESSVDSLTNSGEVAAERAGNAPETVLNSLVQLTGKRQIRALGEALVETIRNALETPSVAFVTVKSPVPFPVHMLPRNNSLPVSSLDDCVQACARSGELVSEQHEEGVLTALPIMINGITVKVLLLHSIMPMSCQQLALLNGFARIYENFLNVMLDVETDSLTGLLNMKGYHSQVLAVLEDDDQSYCEQSGDPKSFWLVIFDIDKFKKINDTFGHLYGDEILLLVANTMIQVFDEKDLLFRFGGDEFVVLLAPRTKQQARAILKQFQKQIAVIRNDKLLQVHCSIGGVNASGANNPTDLLVQADRALYHVKENGRGDIAFYCDLLEQGIVITEHFDDDIELF
ncbi:MAG: GGDEF domain-containing protein [Shewanella sp.]|nr:GGDEF domain-containing protein [Shewanella sp.]MCF1431484.1 GGDEF domain-containing protein [Shewanella sp.]MCF1437819.1 GGDEF domain-containing protein [Shewanella sp.]MCF1459182.1 GGDEF domain-containing protein [Shewanella sp.]